LSYRWTEADHLVERGGFKRMVKVFGLKSTVRRRPGINGG